MYTGFYNFKAHYAMTYTAYQQAFFPEDLVKN
jgi:hypothetical protein